MPCAHPTSIKCSQYLLCIQADSADLVLVASIPIFPCTNLSPEKPHASSFSCSCRHFSKWRMRALLPPNFMSQSAHVNSSLKQRGTVSFCHMCMCIFLFTNTPCFCDFERNYRNMCDYLHRIWKQLNDVETSQGKYYPRFKSWTIKKYQSHSAVPNSWSTVVLCQNFFYLNGSLIRENSILLRYTSLQIRRLYRVVCFLLVCCRGFTLWTKTFNPLDLYCLHQTSHPSTPVPAVLRLRGGKISWTWTKSQNILTPNTNVRPEKLLQAKTVKPWTSQESKHCIRLKMHL